MLKPIAGHEGYYIDTNGNVYSKWINKGIHGLVLGEKFKKLRGSRHKHGYVSYKFNRKGKAHLLHRLVIETFIGPIPENMVVYYQRGSGTWDC